MNIQWSVKDIFFLVAWYITARISSEKIFFLTVKSTYIINTNVDEYVWMFLFHCWNMMQIYNDIAWVKYKYRLFIMKWINIWHLHTLHFNVSFCSKTGFISIGQYAIHSIDDLSLCYFKIKDSIQMCELEKYHFGLVNDKSHSFKIQTNLSKTYKTIEKSQETIKFSQSKKSLTTAIRWW